MRGEGCRGGVIVGCVNRGVGYVIRELSLDVDKCATGSGTVALISVLLLNLFIGRKVNFGRGVSICALVAVRNELDGLDDNGLTLCLKGDLMRTVEHIEHEEALVVTGGVLAVVGIPSGNSLCVRKHRVTVDILGNGVYLNRLNTVLYDGNYLLISVLGVIVVTNLVRVRLSCFGHGFIKVGELPRLIEGDVAGLVECSGAVNKELTLDCAYAALISFTAEVSDLDVVVSGCIVGKCERPSRLTGCREINGISAILLAEVCPQVSVLFHRILTFLVYVGSLCTASRNEASCDIDLDDLCIGIFDRRTVLFEILVVG